MGFWILRPEFSIDSKVWCVRRRWLVTETALTGMRLFYTFLPITGVVLAILIMKDYDISEEKANEIKKQLELKNKK